VTALDGHAGATFTITTETTMTRLDGNVALVTGGSRGIGAAIARRLAQEGADVAFTYVSNADGAAAVAEQVQGLGRRALAIAADGADGDAVVAAVDRTAATLGGLDILVHNAGIYPYGPLEEVTVEDLDTAIALHVRNAFLATQSAANHMDGDGRVITIGSCIAERVPVAGLALYAMTKAAMVGFTKGIARDLGPRGITANIVHPGPTDTDMNPSDGEGADEERALTALGRYGSPEDIASVVAHLASDAGRFITGASIAVDGGYAA
jgi:NAD(P)-dependent dehydrogenase (short-subunit alcohol dehydrogenase family)